MNTPLTRRICFVSTLLPTGLFPAGYADSVDLELDLIGKEGALVGSLRANGHNQFNQTYNDNEIIDQHLFPPLTPGDGLTPSIFD